MLTAGFPIFFVRDVSKAAAFYERTLGFTIDFLYGEPPFYASVSRDRVRIHLRFVHRPNFEKLAAREESLILATIETDDVVAIHTEFVARGADIAAPLTAQPWGGTDFHVRDPDGNVFSFVSFGEATPQ